MARVDVDAFADDLIGRYRRSQLIIDRRIEAAALIATDVASRKALAKFRQEMSGAGLAGLGRAVGQTSDLEQGTIKRRPDGFSASGVLYARSGSKRSRGALQAYTQGANIRPRGRWLWFPTDEIQRVAGRGSDKRRLEPHNWARLGMEAKIGPLVRIRAANGNPLLIVRNVGVSAAGAKRSARSLTKRGQPRKGQVAREFIVAFIAIPNTSRAARVDVRKIVREAQASITAEMREALQRTFK